MKRCGLGTLLTVVLSLCLAAPARAQTVSFTWTQTGPVDGFKILSGPSSGAYNTVTTLVGATPSGAVSGLTVGQTYFFVVEAYMAGLVSGPSNEVSTTVLSADTTCTAPLGSHAIRITPTLLTQTGNKGAGSAARLDFQVASPGSPVTSVGVQANGVYLAPLSGAANPMTGPNEGGLAGMWMLAPTVSGSYPLTIVAANLYGCVQTMATTYTLTVP